MTLKKIFDSNDYFNFDFNKIEFRIRIFSKAEKYLKRNQTSKKYQ